MFREGVTRARRKPNNEGGLLLVAIAFMAGGLIGATVFALAQAARRGDMMIKALDKTDGRNENE